jgi:hypothetical protein
MASGRSRQNARVFSPVWLPVGGFAAFVLFCLIMAALFNRGGKPTKETP